MLLLASQGTQSTQGGAPDTEEENALDREDAAEKGQGKTASHSTWHMTVSGKAEIRQRITLHPNSAFHSFLDLKSLTQLECLITLAIKTDTHKADFFF